MATSQKGKLLLKCTLKI